MRNQPQTRFYDIDAIRCIPILDVCDKLGLAVVKKGKHYWCKVRQEQTPSVILHPDRNIFYDFGNQEKGGVIALVQYASGRKYREAVQFLAGEFGIRPTQTEHDILTKPLTDWEYRSIGLAGDLATKNMTFPIETTSPRDLVLLSRCFQMSMNDLRKQHPTEYENILCEKAIPYVEDLRNSYYRDIWNYYDLLRTFGDGVLFFDSHRTAEKFESRTAALERAERVLEKAAFKTKVQVPPPKRYDPQRVLSHLLQGKLSFSVGTVDQDHLQACAQEASCTVFSVTLSYDDYFRKSFQNYLHCAHFSANEVTAQFLSRDAHEIASLLPGQKKATLSDQISAARQRSGAGEQAIARPPQKEKAIF